MNSYGQFQNAYKRAAVNTLDQGKLIVMLYDGAIKAIGMGMEKMRVNDIEASHTHLVKGKAIISELMSSLNEEKGGDIAKQLKSLYIFMFGQLIEANVTKDPAPAQAVVDLLKELREAWVVIGRQGKQQQAPQQPQFGQSMQGGSPDTVKRINLKG